VGGESGTLDGLGRHKDPVTDAVGSEKPGAARAVAYLRARSWQRILEAVRSRYISLGRPGGTAYVEAPSDEETSAVRDFFGKRPRIDGKGRLCVRLAQLEAQLQASRFSCSLRECLEAYFDAPVITRPEREDRASRDWEQFIQDVDQLLQAHDGLPDASDSRGLSPAAVWWEQAVHDPDSSTLAFVRSHWQPGEENRSLILAVTQVGRALNALSAGSRPAPGYRLAIFASRVCGNPHALDGRTLAGRLLERAILDTVPGAGDLVATTTSSAHQRDLLLGCIGLQRDDLSSTVLAWGLEPVKDEHPDIARSLSALRQSRSVVAFPLWEINRWKGIRATDERAYVVENPAVFGYLVEAALDAGQPRTVICTSGQLSVAGVTLLDKLAAEETTILYSGDFDAGGLGIAAGVLGRYRSCARAWRLDVPSYYAAVAARGHRKLGSQDRRRLQQFSSTFPELVRVMLSTGQKAYQESLVDLLREDLCREKTVVNPNGGRLE